MSMQKSKEIFGASRNIMRNGLHFSAVAVKVAVSLAQPAKADSVVNTAVKGVDTGRKVIPAGLIVSKAGAKVTDSNATEAFGVVYEDVDVTYEASEYVYVPVVIQGVIDERLMPGGAVADAIKKALPGIVFTDK